MLFDLFIYDQQVYMLTSYYISECLSYLDKIEEAFTKNAVIPIYHFVEKEVKVGYLW